eukprot:UN08413
MIIWYLKTTPETHLGYAITWGSFSAIGAGLAGHLLNRQVVRQTVQSYFSRSAQNVVQSQAREFSTSAAANTERTIAMQRAANAMEREQQQQQFKGGPGGSQM